MNKTFYDSFAVNYDEWVRADTYAKEIKTFYVDFFQNYFKNKTNLVELGIGTGNIAQAIRQKTKHEVLGVDNSSAMLEICTKKSKDIKLLQTNILTHTFKQKKKAIYLPYRTFCHFISIEAKQQLLENIYKNLEDGGVFIFDMDIMNKEIRDSLHNKPHLFYSNETLNVYHLYRFQKTSQAIEVTVFISTNKTQEIQVFKYDFSWIETEQTRELLEKIGFKIINLYGDTNKNQLTENSTKQIWVVRK